jgi:hypothetical protein
MANERNFQMDPGALAFSTLHSVVVGELAEKAKSVFQQYRLDKSISFLNFIMAKGFSSQDEARKFYSKCSSDKRFMNSLMSRIDEAIRTSSPTAVLSIASIIGSSIDKENIKLNISNDESIMLSALDGIPENELRFFWLLYRAISTCDLSILPGLILDGDWDPGIRPLYLNIQFNSREYLFPVTRLEKSFSNEGLIAIMNDLITRRIFLVNTGENIGGGQLHLNFGIGRITDSLYRHVNDAIVTTNASIGEQQ